MILEVLNHQQSCTVDDFKGNFINNFTGESSNESKTVFLAWLSYLEVKLQRATDDRRISNLKY